MKKSKGVITIEAALVVPIFVFAVLFMAQFLKIVYIYDTIQTNVYNTAKFINGYTYIADVTKENEYVDKDQDLSKTITKVQEIFTDAVAHGSVNGLGGQLKSTVENFIKSMLASEVQEVSNKIIPEISEKLLDNDLKAAKGSGYKKSLGITSGFDFSKSSITLGAKGEVKLIVEYEVKVEVPLLTTPKTMKLRNQVVIKNFAGV